MEFGGRVIPADARACVERVQELLAELEKGFCLLTNLSDLEEMDLNCLPLIHQMMDAFNRHGIHKIVRVVPDPQKDIGFGIMSLFHYDPHVRVVTCNALAEAQEHLPD